jgi:hypothetical protein
MIAPIASRAEQGVPMIRHRDENETSSPPARSQIGLEILKRALVTGIPTHLANSALDLNRPRSLDIAVRRSVKFFDQIANQPILFVAAQCPNTGLNFDKLDRHNRLGDIDMAEIRSLHRHLIIRDDHGSA